jgi:hypothetical protein
MADSLALAAGQLSLNAWQGKWDEVLAILEHYPSLINHVSQKKAIPPCIRPRGTVRI